MLCRAAKSVGRQSRSWAADDRALGHRTIAGVQWRASVGSTNGTSLSVMLYYQMTYGSSLAADLRIIQICTTVHLGQGKVDFDLMNT
jgi:hypothetical protein